jgi:hypothetical protein
VQGDSVLLTSDPVTPPTFVMLGQQPASDGETHLVLDLPKGWTRQYFDAEVGLADGRVVGGQLSDDSDAIPLAAGDRPISLRLALGVYEIRSDAFRLNGTAASTSGSSRTTSARSHSPRPRCASITATCCSNATGGRSSSNG